MADPIAHGYDWAWAQISGQSVKSNGGTFVVRYLGGSARLTAQERDNLHADGVHILLVWETAADATEGGYARGVADANAANAEADALGYPKDALLLYADDQNDPDPAQEVEYVKGVHYVNGRPSDLYSGGNVLVALDQAGLRTFGGWMVETWYPNAGADPFMVQLANTRDPAMADVAAGQYDTNLLYRPVPMWAPDGSTTFGGDDVLNDDDKKWVTDLVVTAVTNLGKELVGDQSWGTKGILAAWENDTRKLLLSAIKGDNDGLVDAIVAKLPAGGGSGITKADVEAAVRSVLHSA